MIFATAHNGEKSRESIKHFLQAFSSLGSPMKVKTYNGLGCVSQKVQQFFNLWGVKHVIGIPQSSTSQSIIKRAHRSLTDLLEKDKKGGWRLSRAERFSKAVYVFNVLNNSFMEALPPVCRHFTYTTQPKLKEQPPMLIKVSGPFPLIKWGRGYSLQVLDPSG